MENPDGYGDPKFEGGWLTGTAGVCLVGIGGRTLEALAGEEVVLVLVTNGLLEVAGTDICFAS